MQFSVFPLLLTAHSRGSANTCYLPLFAGVPMWQACQSITWTSALRAVSLEETELLTPELFFSETSIQFE